MKTNYLLLFLTLFNAAGAQQIEWATGTAAPANSKGLVCDQGGNVYSYGSVLPNASFYHHMMSNDVTGSFLYKISASGDILYKKRWEKSFHLQNLVHDGIGHFYFAGTFFGSFDIDGHTFTSRGGSDGCLGKMDENGNLLWITTFGDSGNDVCNGITMNHDKTRLVVTGGLSGNFFMNGNLVSPGLQYTMLVAELDLSGSLTQHRQFNFMSGRNEANIGNEISPVANGSYLVLGQQEGRFWTDDTTNAPPYGHYVYRLDTDFNLSWSQYIINGGCYYGYSCAGLSGNAEGDAFVPSFCSYKYGGDGQLRRLNGADGAATWTLSNNDGSYTDTHCAAGNLYLVGTEGANGCPCESHDIGYQVLKSYDHDNNLRWLMKLRDVHLTNITRHESGRIYIAGTYWNENVNIGGQMISGGIPGYYPQRGSFVAALSDLPTLVPRLARNDVFEIYPNPSGGVIDVKIDQDRNIGQVKIRVLNIMGQAVRETELRVQSHSFATRVDLSTEKKGIYFVEISSGGQKRVKQLMVQ